MMTPGILGARMSMVKLADSALPSASLPPPGRPTFKWPKSISDVWDRVSGKTPPPAFRAGPSQLPQAPAPAPPPPTSQVVGGGFRAGVAPQSTGAPAVKPIPSAFAAPTLSSVTPAYYKQPYYGKNLQSEMEKAHAYNAAAGLPGDQNKWTQPVPVLRNDEHAALIGPHYDPRADTVHMWSSDEGRKFTDSVLKHPEGLRDMNMTASQASGSLLDDEDSLKHEAYHGALSSPLGKGVDAYDTSALRLAHADKYEPYFPEQPPIIPRRTLLQWLTNKHPTPPAPVKSNIPSGFYPGYTGGSTDAVRFGKARHHDVASGEMRDYMSQLQEHQFKNTGKRFESPQDYDKFLQGVNPTQPDEAQFEKGIQQYPIDAQRMFRQMRKTNESSPDIYDNIRNWQRTVVPGIVQNGQEINKTASLRELARRLAKL